MFYVNYTEQHTRAPQQVSFEDLFRPHVRHNVKSHIITKVYETEDQIPAATRDLHTQKAQSFQNVLVHLLALYRETDMSTCYTSFRIPKQSGGSRTIQAPNDTLKGQMKIALELLQGFLHPGEAAFAYVPHRNIKDCLTTHQKQGNKWYLHMDLHDFFGSCNPTFIREQLLQIPFFFYLPEQTMSDFIHFITLDNGLPQGTPLSPFITNMLMISFDYNLKLEARKHRAWYTRYADDILISTASRNAIEHVKPLVPALLQGTPFTVNAAKTKVTSIYGKNWNLGLMINKDNNITIGYKRKEKFRATINEFCKNPTIRSQDAMELMGILQYYLSIEPQYFQNLLTKYGQKFNMDIRAELIRCIKAR